MMLRELQKQLGRIVERHEQERQDKKGAASREVLERADELFSTFAEIASCSSGSQNRQPVR